MTISVLDRNRAADKTEVEPQARSAPCTTQLPEWTRSCCPAGSTTRSCGSPSPPRTWSTPRPCASDCPVQALCLDGALERREPWGVWGGELFLQGVVIPRKRPRGRPRKSEQVAAQAGQNQKDGAAA